jgi:iron-sulfur cluster assembly protein
MLTITDNAGLVVNDLVGNAVTTDTGGIRLVAEENRIGASIAEEPMGGDVVAENGAARVFMEPAVADALSDKMLDAQVAEDGQVQFLIAPQPA